MLSNIYNRPQRGHMFIAFLQTHTFDHIVVAAYIQHPYCKYIIRLGYGVCSLFTVHSLLTTSNDLQLTLLKQKKEENQPLLQRIRDANHE